LPREHQKAARLNGTTFGPPITEDQKAIQRVFGDQLDVVTLRYTR